MKSVAPGACEAPETGKHTNNKVGLSVLNFASCRPTQRSKKNTSVHKQLDFVRALLSAGKTVTEGDVPDCRRYKGDCVRVLRRVHQCYPDRTKLFVRYGLWCIAPVFGDGEQL